MGLHLLMVVIHVHWYHRGEEPLFLDYYGLVSEMHCSSGGVLDESPAPHPLCSRRRLWWLAGWRLMGSLFYFGEVGQNSEAERTPRVCPVQLMSITGA